MLEGIIYTFFCLAGVAGCAYLFAAIIWVVDAVVKHRA